MAKRQTGTAAEPRLEDILMKCRNLLRGKMGLANKRDMLLTLTFLKFTDEKFEDKQREILAELAKEGIAADSDFAKQNLENPNWYGDGFYLPKECRYSYLVNEMAQKDLALAIDDVVAKLNACILNWMVPYPPNCLWILALRAKI